MLYRILLLVLAVLIWATCYWTGADSHAADGTVFFGLVGSEALLIWLQSRQASRTWSLLWANCWGRFYLLFWGAHAHTA